MALESSEGIEKTISNAISIVVSVLIYKYFKSKHQEDLDKAKAKEPITSDEKDAFNKEH